MRNFKELSMEEFVNLSKGELIELIAFAKVGEMKAFLKKLGHKTSKMKKVNCIEMLKYEIDCHEAVEKLEDRSEIGFKVDVAKEMAKKTEGNYELQCKLQGLKALFTRNADIGYPDKNEVVIKSFEQVKNRLANNKEKLEKLTKLKNEIDNVNVKLENTGLFIKLEITQNIENGEIGYTYALVGNGVFINEYDLDFDNKECSFDGILSVNYGIIPSWFEGDLLFDFEGKDDYCGIKDWRNKVIIVKEDSVVIELPTDNNNRGIDYTKDLLNIKLETIEKIEGLEIEDDGRYVDVNNHNKSISFDIETCEIAEMFKCLNNNLKTSQIDYDLDNRATQDIEAFEESIEYIDDKIEEAELVDFNNISDKRIAEKHITAFLEADYKEVETEEEFDELEDWDFN